MIQDIMPGTEEQLKKEMTSAYIGFDPTAEAFTSGAWCPFFYWSICKERTQAIALVGGAPVWLAIRAGKVRSGTC